MDCLLYTRTCTKFQFDPSTVLTGCGNSPTSRRQGWGWWRWEVQCHPLWQHQSEARKGPQKFKLFLPPCWDYRCVPPFMGPKAKTSAILFACRFVRLMRPPPDDRLDEVCVELSVPSYSFARCLSISRVSVDSPLWLKPELFQLYLKSFLIPRRKCRNSLKAWWPANPRVCSHRPWDLGTFQGLYTKEKTSVKSLG